MERFFSYIQLLKEIQKDTMALMDHIYQPYGLTSTQAFLLLYLKENGRKNITEISTAMCTGKSNISPLCKRMELGGYIKKMHDINDSRIIYIELTKHAEDILRDSTKRFETTIQTVFGEADSKENELILNGLECYHDLLQNHNIKNEELT